MALTAMWTHGTSIVAEHPENLDRNVRFGFGADTLLKSGRDCWFHAPMPTPVIVGNKRPKLVRVIILFSADVGQARLEDVHLFDGSTRVKSFDVLEGGAHLTVDSSNTFNLDPQIDIAFGLGVSFRFAASTQPPNPSQKVFISAVGADYEFT